MDCCIHVESPQLSEPPSQAIFGRELLESMRNEAERPPAFKRGWRGLAPPNDVQYQSSTDLGRESSKSYCLFKPSRRSTAEMSTSKLPTLCIASPPTANRRKVEARAFNRADRSDVVDSASLLSSYATYASSKLGRAAFRATQNPSNGKACSALKKSKRRNGAPYKGPLFPNRPRNVVHP